MTSFGREATYRPSGSGSNFGLWGGWGAASAAAPSQPEGAPGSFAFGSLQPHEYEQTVYFGHIPAESEHKPTFWGTAPVEREYAKPSFGGGEEFAKPSFGAEGPRLALEWLGPQITRREQNPLTSFRGTRRRLQPSGWYQLKADSIIAGPFDNVELARANLPRGALLGHLEEYWV